MLQWIRSNWPLFYAALAVAVTASVIWTTLDERTQQRASVEHASEPEPDTGSFVLSVSSERGSYEVRGETEHEEPETWLWLRSPEDALAWLTLFLVIGTGFLAYYTANLWREAEESSRKQRRAERRAHARELRAYINITSARITYNWAKKTWESRIEWRNYGKTPARKARIYGVLWLTTWPIEEANLKRITDEDKDASRFVLGPTAGRTKIDEPENAGMFDVDDTELREGTWTQPAKKALVAMGRIYYEDIFGQPHETAYRYYVGGNEGLRDRVGQDPRVAETPGDLTYRMVAHSSGNDAD